MDSDQLGILRLGDLGNPITLDSRMTGDPGPHWVVKGTLVGVRHYIHPEVGEKRTQVEIRTFGGPPVLCEFANGSMAQPADEDADVRRVLTAID